ncbi:MAG: hypothetical protein ABIH49_01415 [archaeon]
MILNDLKNILKYFAFPIAILITNFLFLFMGFYENREWMGMFLHVIGGISVAFAYFFSLKYFETRNYLKLNSVSRIVFVVSLVGLTAVFWEFFEFSLTYITGMSFQGNLSDTMNDLLLGLLGGFAGVLFFNNLRR